MKIMDGVALKNAEEEKMYKQLQETYPNRGALNYREVAEYLGVCEKTVRNMSARVINPIPTKRIGRRVIVPLALLAVWLCNAA